ncbi:hypothetical protein V495_02532 [Pseudogymnoascus sp. VKM F-4514 (FW-929)]|nr:hypothetical protein V495_02532 [Pseudogymnoascus sp. VKM F-4514 (FW-929)]
MHSSGFAGAPVSRSLVLGIIAASILVSVTDIKYYFWIQVDPHFWKYGQLWRAFIYQLCYTNSSEVLMAAMTLYSLRGIERLWGSRKFASFLLVLFPLTALLPPLILALVIRPLSFNHINYLPAGLTPLIYALVAQYHAAIPHTYKYRIAATPSPPPNAPFSGLTFSDKSYTYLLVGQLALAQFPGSLLGAVIGWAVGYLWRNEALPGVMVSWRVPGWMVGIAPQKRGEGFEGLRRRLEEENTNAAAATGSDGRQGGNVAPRRTLGRQRRPSSKHKPADTMRTARQAPPDTSSGRRAQPVRQTRANPPRAHSGLGRSFGARDASGRISPDEDEQTEIYPAITHFADAITALPRELVRHFTLLKEVDAKIFAPEEALVQLVETALNHPLPARSQSTDRLQITDSTPTPGSVPMSVNGSIAYGRNTGMPDDADNPDRATAVYDADNLPRRQLFRQCAYTMQEMLVSLDEKNHVISTATEALDKHLARLTDCLPFVEGEISEEARHGNTKHWAYTENRVVNKPNERSRRENANVNHLTNAAAAAAAEEAAARSDARKQAMLAKKGRAQLAESDFDDNTDHRKDNKRPHGNTKKGRPADTSNSGGTTNGGGAHANPPSKRRKVEKGPNGGAVMERSISSVYGSNGTGAKGKANNSPRGTPLPDPKKRSKAAATTNGQPRKRNAAANSNVMSPRLASSPVRSVQEIKNNRNSPPPANGRPTAMRARQNSIQNVVDSSRPRASSSTSNKPNGINTLPDLSNAANVTGRPIPEIKATMKETAANTKGEHVLEDADPTDPAMRGALLVGPRKDGPLKHEDVEPAGDAAQTVQTVIAPPVMTKSGRASKPSTPAMPTFSEPVRAGSRRNTVDGAGAKRSHKKGAGQAAQLVAAQPAEDDAGNSVMGDAEDDEEVEVDANEPRYCYCNGVSYGEMVACDNDNCAKEWFHMECAGLKVAPKNAAKWYCDDYPRPFFSNMDRTRRFDFATEPGRPALLSGAYRAKHTWYIEKGSDINDTKCSQRRIEAHFTALGANCAYEKSNAPRHTSATMATADPFANPAWEGNSRLPTHPAPAAAQSWQSSVGRSSAEEKAIEDGAPYAAPTFVATGTTAPKPGLKERFDGIMPPNRRYLGRSRRTVLLGALGLLALLILALGLGLGLGLKKKGGDAEALPLPGNATPHTGDLTYYSPGPGYGSCGFENTSYRFLETQHRIPVT